MGSGRVDDEVPFEKSGKGTGGGTEGKWFCPIILWKSGEEEKEKNDVSYRPRCRGLWEGHFVVYRRGGVGERFPNHTLHKGGRGKWTILGRGLGEAILGCPKKKSVRFNQRGGNCAWQKTEVGGANGR